MATILDGRKVSNSMLEEVKAEVGFLKEKGVDLKLVVVVVGEDPASKVYVKHKEKACAKTGVEFERVKFDEDLSQEDLIAKIEELNADASVNGMIVQLPLPKHMDPAIVIRAIDPRKDVDGFHAYNVGKMFLNKAFEHLAPCTPKGMIRILEDYEVDLTGLEAVVVGRSNIVGKPIATMLTNRNATVTVCHRHTQDLAEHTRRADLIVVAVGKPGLITADMVKEGVIVLDVGINRLETGKLVGDVDFDGVAEKAGMITPVPGGVGPMTVACLLSNTVTAAKRQHGLGD
jgi:methylenetetrahydrofolate dehydrogenase (NADP+) / methenyltetrahydrofolate cyclohydrolase